MLRKLATSDCALRTHDIFSQSAACKILLCIFLTVAGQAKSALPLAFSFQQIIKCPTERHSSSLARPCKLSPSPSVLSVYARKLYNESCSQQESFKLAPLQPLHVIFNPNFSGPGGQLSFARVRDRPITPQAAVLLFDVETGAEPGRKEKGKTTSL